ncbi:MAG: C40 family peptidase [Bacteroidetes bacterium]|nr:C40 family peptidase [Bacteroidota bacterium]
MKKHLLFILLNLWISMEINAQVSLSQAFSVYSDTNKYVPIKPIVKDSSYARIHRAFQIEAILNLATTYIGTKYTYGGHSEKGFDCSGFMNHLFNYFGYDLPRSSRDIAKIGKDVKMSELQRGDFAFFSNRTKNVIGHIGIIIEVNKTAVKMIHASRESGITIVDIANNAYFKSNFILGRRWTETKRK